MKKESVPVSQRKHIAIIGKTNAGKSTLFNALLGQDNAIVSPVAGTTADPVAKAAELIPYGSVVLIDTAGLYDASELGEERMKKTSAVLRRADIVIFTADPADFDELLYSEFKTKNTPHILVFTKCGGVESLTLNGMKSKFPKAVFLDDMNEDGLNVLRGKLSNLLESLAGEEKNAVEKILSPEDTVVMVVPIDSEAPRGRLILPQVQILRQCLDYGVKSVVVRPSELSGMLGELKKIDLVITDSQAFTEVSAMVSEDIPLTSFSMLLAYNKGDFKLLAEGCGTVERLSEGSRILMLEGCTHNSSHEDIGRHKIPALLKKYTGKDFRFDFYSGYDFPEKLNEYSFAVQCGSCMLNGRELISRLAILQDNAIPVTNYGILLAYLNGIFERSLKIFKRAGLL